MVMPSFRFAKTSFPHAATELRAQVRQFVVDQEACGSFVPGPGSWTRFDADMSAKIGAQGWIGMTWPKRYGGHERSALERYVVTEELLAAGVPLRAHYSADRQIGPLILQFGNEEQKRKFLPLIAAGKCACAIGLSEPDSGSDLAAMRTRATRVDGGWRVEGRKMWIGHAHKAQILNLFLRTSSTEESRHSGISRFLIDMSWPGITVRPIINLHGDHDYNEVVFDDLFVPDNMVVGEIGQAWSQLGSDLAYERSAPDRWLGAFETLKCMIDELARRPGPRQEEACGRLVAHLWTFREMSLSIAGMLERGQLPNVEAAVVKDLGTAFDQEIPNVARSFFSESMRADLDDDNLFEAVLDYDLLYAPSLSIKGGTREMLRNAIARGLGLR